MYKKPTYMAEFGIGDEVWYGTAHFLCNHV